MAENNTDAPIEAPDKFERLSHAVAAKSGKIGYLVASAVILVVLAVVTFTLLRRSNAARENAAENQVFQSIMDMQNNPETADAVAVFGRQAEEFAGLPAGQRALLLQFAFAYNARDYAVAERTAREFIRANPRNILLPRVRLALGQTLLQLDRIGDAISLFRELAAANDPGTFPEAKLALAQALERDAEQVRDNPDEYRRRLQAAEMEYNDIISRARIVGAQRGFWPQAVILPADFALVQIRDRLAGHVLGEPAFVDAPITDAEREAVMSIRPPEAGTAGTAAPDAIAAAARAADTAILDAATAARDSLDAAAVAADRQSPAVRAAVKAGFDAIIDASDAARREIEAAAASFSERAEGAEAAALAGLSVDARESFDAAVKTGTEAIATIAAVTRSVLDTTVARAESIGVARDVIDLQGRTGLGALSAAANDAVKAIETAAARASEGLGDGAHAVGEATRAGYDAVGRIADEGKTALERIAGEAVAKVDEVADMPAATPGEAADSISKHVADARAALENVVKSGSDALAKAVESALAAIEAGAVHDREDDHDHGEEAGSPEGEK